MFYGDIVNVSDYSFLKIFCPDLSYVDFVPLYGDSYIINARMSPIEFRKSFKRSILLSPVGLDLSNRKFLLERAAEKIKITEKAKESFMDMTEEEFWPLFRLYTVVGKIPNIEERASIYQLFLSLGGPKQELIKEYYKLEDFPIEVIFSTVLTFLLKMKNLKDFSGSPIYKRDLEKVKSRLGDYKSNLVKVFKVREKSF